MDKGITVEEIKLYDAGEDDEMVPDCTENNFEDLENLITKVRLSTPFLVDDVYGTT